MPTSKGGVAVAEWVWEMLNKFPWDKLLTWELVAAILAGLAIWLTWHLANRSREDALEADKKADERQDKDEKFQRERDRQQRSH